MSDGDQGQPPSGPPRILELLALLPILSALAYTFGAAYALGFYRQIGIDNLDLLGFSVQTYVLNSYTALTTLLRYLSVFEGALIVAGVAVATSIVFAEKPRRAIGLIVTMALLLAALVVTPVGRGPVVVSALTIVVALADSHRAPSTSGSNRAVLLALVALACVIVGWQVLVATARTVGQQRACEVAGGADQITPLVEIVTSRLPYPSSGATPVETFGDVGGESRLSNLRLYNTAPAGLIVYADNSLPERLIFIPSDHIISVAIQPDGGNVSGGQVPTWCR